MSRGEADAVSSYLPGGSRSLQLTTTSSSAPISTLSSTRVREIGTSGRRALIDTSILIDLRGSEFLELSKRAVTSALAIAELARGPGAATGELEQRRRRRHLEQIEASVEALPFDRTCARAYGAACEAVERIGRKPRDARAVDLMIAATALAHDLPLYTLNSRDLRGLEGLIEIVDASA